MATSDSSEDDEPTWELTLSGVTAGEIGLLLNGLAHMTKKADPFAPDVAKMCSDLNQQVLRENPEAARYMILDGDTAEFITGRHLPDDLLDDLDLVIENGAFMDARAIRDVEFGGEGQDHA